MKCESCDLEMIERRATLEDPYIYTMSGLKHVGLVGIQVRQCPRCKDESPIIPRIGELHRVIAQMLIHKPALLTGDEIRFLRKQAGFPANDFAALLGINPAYLSRVETGKVRKFGRSADRLVRVVAGKSGVGEEAKQFLLSLAQRLVDRSRIVRQQTFTLERNHWKAAA